VICLQESPVSRVSFSVNATFTQKLISTVNREIFAALKVGEFAFFQLADRQNSAFAAEI
jgi:hypothetical protein